MKIYQIQLIVEIPESELGSMWDVYYEINNVGFPPNIYPRPELELVSKWFMEKKDINITVNLLRNEYNSRWCYNVDHIMVDQILHRWHPKDETYLTYENALSEAIKFCLILI